MPIIVLGIDAASALQVTATRLTWRDLSRYSNRQQRKTPLGGFTGTLHLQGDLTPFARLLRTAEILHVGKGTTFGLGRFQIEG
jgi:CRISPR/Cas system endoribonuclease Cas6 (RAMP superfamily)